MKISLSKGIKILSNSLTTLFWNIPLDVITFLINWINVYIGTSFRRFESKVTPWALWTDEKNMIHNRKYSNCQSYWCSFALSHAFQCLTSSQHTRSSKFCVQVKEKYTSQYTSNPKLCVQVKEKYTSQYTSNPKICVQVKEQYTAHQKLKFCVWVKEKYKRFSLINVFNILWIFQDILPYFRTGGSCWATIIL